ncbi:MAG TPA: hypothetical protein VJ715_12405 [Pyrinomonadaceae bacterium]|nr:hypothetical protein [Pyrinomonadaceae bacterium]
MKDRLRVLAVSCFLCGLVAGGLALWLYTQARARADEGMGLRRQALQLYDQSDAFKGTPEEDKLIREGQRVEQAGDATLASARTSRLWAMISGISSIVLVVTAIAAIMAHLKRKEADSPS